jgi:hypothetical protein
VENIMSAYTDHQSLELKPEIVRQSSCMTKIEQGCKKISGKKGNWKN